VIATGGGVVLRAENRALLANAGNVVWLRAIPETIVNRMAADPESAETRPPLTNRDALAEVVEMMRTRGPLYQSCAQEIVDTDDKSPVDVAAEVQARLGMVFRPEHSEPGESA
jgi:shikimate kinase